MSYIKDTPAYMTLGHIVRPVGILDELHQEIHQPT